MFQNPAQKNALILMADLGRRQALQMARRDAQTISDGDVKALIIAWHDPRKPLPAPDVTIPMLLKQWGAGLGSHAPWHYQVKIALYHEIARGKQLGQSIEMVV